MNQKRKAVELHIEKILSLMEPTKINATRYKDMFAKMTDAEFDLFMQDIRDKKKKIICYAPNMKITLLVEHLLEAAKACNCLIEQHIVFKDPLSGIDYCPPTTFPILKLPIRRTRQYLMHKISVPENDKKIDALTGQVSQESQASKFSGPEAQILYGRGLTKTITEFYKVRGGDVPAYANFKQQLEETGAASMTQLDENTVTRSTMTLGLLFNCMLIENNFVDTQREGV